MTSHFGHHQTGIGNVFRGIYTTSATALDKHLSISDYCFNMYTSLVILLALAACAATAPADDVISPIVNQSQENPNPDRSYKSSYEAGNGTNAEEEDHLEDAGIEDVALMTESSFSPYFEDIEEELRKIFGPHQKIEYRKSMAEMARLRSMNVSTTSEIPQLIQDIIEWRGLSFG